MSENQSGDGKLRIIGFGAHPDDAEILVGGTAMLWSALGHEVELVSVTNGDIGHTRIKGPELAARRLAEVQQCAKIFGTTVRVLDIHDGELMPTLENRRTITRLIRQARADIVISHRPNDYHPDHRYVGVLVQDSAFMVTVPFFCPDTPHIPFSANPVFLFMSDNFQQPYPFRADIVVAIDTVLERKLDALLKLESAFVENTCIGPYPENEAQRAAFAKAARERLRGWFAGVADRYRDKLVECYGEEQGRQVRYAEAFEICEYGRQPTAGELKRLFPFLPGAPGQKGGPGAEEEAATAQPILALWETPGADPTP
jgi:LmbE family N-acetylglucosaminyl deacetylase